MIFKRNLIFGVLLACVAAYTVAAYSGAGEAADLATSPRNTSERDVAQWQSGVNEPGSPYGARIRDSAPVRFRASRSVTSVGAALHILGAVRGPESAGVTAPVKVRRPQSVVHVVRSVFGRYGSQALRVSWCESRWHTTARNGQYLGLFQMGSWERRTFGHGAGAWAQARAAHRYFVATGRDWSPWTCRP